MHWFVSVRAAAIIRATVVDDADGRESLVEIELATAGRNRVQVNRQRLQRVRDLLGTVRVTVFSPDDLILVKGSPGDRRRSSTTPWLRSRSSTTRYVSRSTASSVSATPCSNRPAGGSPTRSR